MARQGRSKDTRAGSSPVSDQRNPALLRPGAWRAGGACVGREVPSAAVRVARDAQARGDRAGGPARRGEACAWSLVPACLDPPHHRGRDEDLPETRRPQRAATASPCLLWRHVGDGDQGGARGAVRGQERRLAVPCRCPSLALRFVGLHFPEDKVTRICDALVLDRREHVPPHPRATARLARLALAASLAASSASSVRATKDASGAGRIVYWHTQGKPEFEVQEGRGNSEGAFQRGSGPSTTRSTADPRVIDRPCSGPPCEASPREIPRLKPAASAPRPHPRRCERSSWER
jgi:hypothetical protein